MTEEHGQVVDSEEEELDPEQEARRRLALAQIRQYPDVALRLRAPEVETFDDDLSRLAERMMRLMFDARGIGLAATQAGVLRRLFVFTKDDDEQPMTIVNPVLVESGDDRELDEEGCLSLRGVRVPVERATTITLEAQDLSGTKITLELAGIDARVAQHELDHLDGVLIIDRTTDEARREALAALRPAPVLGTIP